MSVLMTLRVSGNAKAVEAMPTDMMKAIVDRALDQGVIRHRFYGSDDEILVVDEWPDAESFQSFFDSAGPDIQKVMEEAGVTSQPTIEFWRPLDVDDAVG